MLKIFISHTFSKEDQELGLKLSEHLSENKMNGYLAEKEKAYTILINEKIEREIESSDCLVAIMTDDGLASGSVHEEIGFALGKDIPVLLMVEENLKEKGVLIQGKEPEYFNDMNFKSRSQNIIDHIQKDIDKKIIQIHESMKEFLIKRNLIDSEMNDFCRNSQTKLLQSRIDKPLILDGTPFILFSAYPRNETKINVHTEIDKFIKEFDFVNIQDHKIHFLEGRKKIEMNSIVYYDRRDDDSIYKYLEFQKNGFIEQGFSGELIYLTRDYTIRTPALHACWITGAFWAFVKFSKLYYERKKNIKEFDVVLSIRNCKDLTLLGYSSKGDTLSFSGIIIPKTKQSNIRMAMESLELDQINDEDIATKVYETSNTLAHAYGLESSTCYDHDNMFDWDLMDKYAPY